MTDETLQALFDHLANAVYMELKPIKAIGLEPDVLIKALQFKATELVVQHKMKMNQYPPAKEVEHA